MFQNVQQFLHATQRMRKLRRNDAPLFRFPHAAEPAVPAAQKRRIQRGVALCKSNWAKFQERIARNISRLAGSRLCRDDLIITPRIQPKLLRQLRTTIDDAMDAAGLPLIGVVPEDPRVILSANQGRPLILNGRQGAATACLNIAKRIQGLRVPIMRIR